MRPESPTRATGFRLKAGRSRGGFTVLEVMLMVAVMTIVVTLVTVSFQSSLSVQQINASAFRLSGDLTQAAQLAITRNQTIALVFLRESEPMAGEEEEAQFRGWQLHAANPLTGALEPLGEPARLDGGIVFMNHFAYSSILHRPRVEDEPWVIRFKPAGGTDLPTGSGEHWCLTLALESDALKDVSVLPPSSRTVVVNAHTGMVTGY